MRVAKIQIEAPATSFRHPHFLIGQQLTYDMPPPSTIYGQVASALGQLPAPESLRFAYAFRCAGRASDLEHQHIITAGGPKATFVVEGEKHHTSLDVTVQPHKREFLFRPKLTLYLDPPELAQAFLAPAFCTVLGRSQDLAAITACEVVELEQQTRAYFEDTLLPFSMRQSVAIGATVLMPRYIEPPPERHAQFDRFIALRERVFAGVPEHPGSIASTHRLLLQGEELWWVDRSTPVWNGAHRGVWFHGFR